ncbi:MAG: hypothetical protein P9M13_05370 [Candidatus Ancaeobacter aquaticus]|nr:hypothetical protein [Candidatus Ancaeobacter aquaticus]
MKKNMSIGVGIGIAVLAGVVLVTLFLSKEEWKSGGKEAIQPAALSVKGKNYQVVLPSKLTRKDVLPSAITISDIEVLPLLDNEKNDVVKTYETLKKSLASKDTSNVVNAANKLRYYGLKEISDSGFKAIAATYPDIKDKEKLADDLDKNTNPGAGVIYGCVVKEAIKKNAFDTVSRVIKKLAVLPSERESWHSGMMYLLGEAKKRKDIGIITDLSRDMFFNADYDGAQAGFQARLSLAKDKSQKLDTALEYESFGYNIFSKKDLMMFIDDAREMKNNEAAIRFIGQLYGKDKKKAVEVMFSFVDTAVKEDVPIEDIAEMTMPLAYSTDDDARSSLFKMWRTLGASYVKAKDPHGIEMVAEFVGALPGDEGKKYAFELMNILLKIEPKIDIQQKVAVLQKAVFFGESSKQFLEKQAPDIFKEAIRDNNAQDIESLSWDFINSDSEALQSLGIEGYTEIAEKLTAKGDYVEIVGLSKRFVGFKDDEKIKKKAMELWKNAFKEIVASGAKPEDIILEAVDGAAFFRDPEVSNTAKEGVNSCRNSIKNDSVFERCDYAGLLMNSRDKDMEQIGRTILNGAVLDMKNEDDPDQLLSFAELLIQMNDPQYNREGIDILKKLWDINVKEKSFTNTFVSELISVIYNSEDEALIKAVKKTMETAKSNEPADDVLRLLPQEKADTE